MRGDPELPVFTEAELAIVINEEAWPVSAGQITDLYRRMIDRRLIDAAASEPVLEWLDERILEAVDDAQVVFRGALDALRDRFNEALQTAAERMSR